MAERIDHAAKAEQIVAETPSKITELEAVSWFAEAQVHATLALVEQQRIANLIALEAQCTGEADQALYIETGPEWGAVRELRPDIKAALGIEAVA